LMKKVSFFIEIEKFDNFVKMKKIFELVISFNDRCNTSFC